MSEELKNIKELEETLSKIREVADREAAIPLGEKIKMVEEGKSKSMTSVLLELIFKQELCLHLITRELKDIRTDIKVLESNIARKLEKIKAK